MDIVSLAWAALMVVFTFSTRSVGKKWALEVLLQESNRINCSIDCFAMYFELFQIKISEFRISLDSNGVIYEYESYSIKELFQRFPYLFFEKNGIPVIGN